MCDREETSYLCIICCTSEAEVARLTEFRRQAEASKSLSEDLCDFSQLQQANSIDRRHFLSNP